MAQKSQYTAGGNISPCCFVVQSTTTPFTVTQAASAGAQTIGIAQEGTTVPPIKGYTDATSVYAGTLGLPIRVFGEHEECLVVAGGAISIGDLLATDANGKAAVAKSGDWVGARALEAATAAGTKIRVVVEHQRKL